MKVFHIIFEPLDGIISGAKLRNTAINTALCGAFNTTTIVLQDFFKVGKTFPARTPAFIVADLPEILLETVSKQVQDEKPDVIIIEGVFLNQLTTILRASGAKIIVDAHNVESTLLRQIDLAARPRYHGPFKALGKRSRWQQAEAAESQLGQLATSIWACSEQDKQDLAALVGPQTPIDVVPNPVPGWCANVQNHQSAAFQSDAIRLLFVGHLGYAPNINAARTLASDILPLIRRKYPQTTLTICGRAPARRLTSFLGKATAVTLIASPEDLAPLYQDADVALIPLSEGGGTRIKVLEAMACGLPVIASAKAVEGLGLTDGAEFLLANTPEEYTQALTDLATDNTLRTQMIGQASSFIAARHSQGIVTATLKHLLNSAAHDRSTPPAP